MKDSKEIIAKDMDEFRKKYSKFYHDNTNLLEKIFGTQEQLQLKIRKNNHEFFHSPLSDQMKEHGLALIMEAAEIMDRIPYKHWKNYSIAKNINMLMDPKLAEEIIDAFHFIINLWLTLGYDYKDFFAMYMAKNMINFKRQENGY